MLLDVKHILWLVCACSAVTQDGEFMSGCVCVCVAILLFPHYYKRFLFTFTSPLPTYKINIGCTDIQMYAKTD